MKLQRRFTSGNLKGVIIPEDFHTKPIKVTKTAMGDSPYVVEPAEPMKKSKCRPCMGKAIKAAIIAAQPEAAPGLAIVPNCPNKTGIKVCVLGKGVSFRSGNPGKSDKLPKGKCKVVDEFIHCRVKDKKYFDPRSFRTVSPNEDTRITIGCQKGEWDSRKHLCKVSTEAQRIMYRGDGGAFAGAKL